MSQSKDRVGCNHFYVVYQERDQVIGKRHVLRTCRKCTLLCHVFQVNLEGGLVSNEIHVERRRIKKDWLFHCHWPKVPAATVTLGKVFIVGKSYCSVSFEKVELRKGARTIASCAG